MSLFRTLRLTILNTARCKHDNTWQYNNINNPFSRLYLIHSGKGWIYHHGQKWHLRPGCMYLIPSFTLSSYCCIKHIEISYVHFTNQLQGGSYIYDMLPFNYQQCGISRHIPRLMERLIDLNPGRGLIETDPARYDKQDLTPQLNDSDNIHNPSGLIESNGILLQLFSGFIKAPGDAEHRRLLARHRFRDVTHYIDQHLDRQISLSELAGIVYLSPDYFSRLFYQTMEVRPIEYINRKRIEKAQFLLAATGKSISEVGRQVGFNNLTYFHRIFLKYVQSTPGQYRNIHRNLKKRQNRHP